MLSVPQKLQPTLHSLVNPSTLLVSQYSEDAGILFDALLLQNTDFARCDSAAAAAILLQKAKPDLVVCEQHLPDGSWKDVLTACEKLETPPLVLVLSEGADERLWAEVLNLGGYDLLTRPFDRLEVSRVLGMACHQVRRGSGLVRDEVSCYAV